MIRHENEIKAYMHDMLEYNKKEPILEDENYYVPYSNLVETLHNIKNFYNYLSYSPSLMQFAYVLLIIYYKE